MNMFKPSSNFLTDCSKAMLLLWFLFVSVRRVFLCHTVLFVSCSLVVTYWETSNFLSLLYVIVSSILSLSHMVSCVGVVLDCIDS